MGVTPTGNRRPVCVCGGGVSGEALVKGRVTTFGTWNMAVPFGCLACPAPHCPSNVNKTLVDSF